MMDDYDNYQFDTSVQRFKAWLEQRAKQGKRDRIDALGKRLAADKRIPAQASKSLYLAHLRSKGYSQDDQQSFVQAWSEMRTAADSEQGGEA